MKESWGKKTTVCGLLLLLIGASSVAASTASVMIQNQMSQIPTNHSVSSSGTEWWPMFHHDQYHTGYSTGPAPETNYTLWSTKIGNIELSSPTVVNGKVYIGDFDNTLHCLNAITGDELWNYTTTMIIESSAAVVNGKVYFGADQLYCLDADTGSLVWSYTTNAWFVASPTVVGTALYVGDYENGTFLCLNAETGKQLWNFSADASIVSSAAVAENQVYFASVRTLFCLNATTGVERWNRTIGISEVFSSPTLVSGNLLIGSDDGHFYCLNATNGSERWNYSVGGWIVSTPAVSNNRVYFGDDAANLYCLNLSDGSLVWTVHTKNSIFSSPALADGKVYVGSEDHTLSCYNMDTGSLIWNYTTGDGIASSPGIANGRIYIGSYDGTVYCFGNENQAPLPITIVGPTIGQVGSVYQFNITILDPDGDLVYCLLDWGDGNTSWWLGPFDSGVAFSASHAWSQPGTYEIKVKAKDSYGAESNWSEPMTITIVELTPAIVLGLFNNLNHTGGLLIIEPRLLLILPSENKIYTTGTIVLSDDFLGFRGVIFIVGKGNIAILP
jgi:outer membrane protein assembly factor BamB